MIVLDSSFVVAYHNTRDVHHAAATEVMPALAAGRWGRALLLEYVFLEIVTVLMVRRNVAVANDVGDALLRAREVDFVPCSDFFPDTLRTFREQSPGDTLSFVDCAIVTVARRTAPARIASFDRGLSSIPGLEVIPGAAAK